jgi:D-alanyl-D-alanine carboxypeptidase (penicillin-binding protein 5/6)
MTRTTVLRLIATCYTIATVSMLGWIGFGYVNSAPTVLAAVQGASTDSSIVTAPTATPFVPALATLPPGIYPNIAANEYVLYDMDNGTVVTHSANLAPVPIASTTKLMTAHVTSKYGNMDAVTTVSQTAATIGGSVCGLKAGEQLTIKNLMYCMLLPSGNDAAHTLAEYVGGILLGAPNATTDQKTARFVQAMNAEAARLHMTSSHYLDPAGLDDNGHSNAIDEAKIASLDFADPNIKNVLDTSDYVVTDVTGTVNLQLHNSDHLIADEPYPGLIGGKTGFTPAAGHCLVTGATQNGHTLIAVVLGTDEYDDNASAVQARALLNFGFQNIVWK